MARRLTVAALVLAVMFHVSSIDSAADAANVPAHSSNACKRSDSACLRCAKPKKGNKNAPSACVACSANGPIPSFLDSGVCFCPAGSARVGSPGTAVAGGAPAHSKKNKIVPRACAPCAVDFYAPGAQPVAGSECLPCDDGTGTDGQTGATACTALIPPGSYLDTSVTPPQVEPCPPGNYCTGGSAQPVRCPTCEFSCPGSSSPDDCFPSRRRLLLGC